MFARIRRIAPRRGWRAFIGEVGIIVLGVLIAVGIGKAVEALDWRAKVAAAHATLDEDIEGSNWPEMTERVAVTPCLLRQLDRLRDYVLTGSPDRRPTVIGGAFGSTVFVHPTRLWTDSAWQIISADNVPAHMSSLDRVLYQQHFADMRQLAILNDAETSATADLLVLADPVALDTTTRVQFLRLIAQERSRIELMALIADQGMKQMRAFGKTFSVPASRYVAMNTRTWCKANGLL